MPVYNMGSLCDNEFLIAGELFATSIVQRGPAPCFLSKEVYSYIVGGIASVTPETWASKVKDEKLKCAIDEVSA
jgi:hypothetical protein